MFSEIARRAENVSTESSGMRRYLDLIVAFRWVAAAGALIAAIAPAVVASRGGPTLRGSVSAYWNLDSDLYFEVPFTIAAVLIFIDGILSYVSSNRDEFGRRWYNLVLGVAMATLTWWNLDDSPVIHGVAAATFFVLFILVIGYTTALAWVGRHVEGQDHVHNREVEVAGAQVGAVFFVLLLLTLIAYWPLGIVSFFFFEIFALVNFALFYVQASVRPFPYNHYEFPIDAVNSVLRALRLMR